jgi:eukaryotic-like serine/threonine-protein kinase
MPDKLPEVVNYRQTTFPRGLREPYLWPRLPLETAISPPEQLREALKDRYALERELGRGGMATVYLARDLRHDRPVALKVLHAELAATMGPDRFQREIRLAARLQHPHVLTVHDSGEITTPGRPPILWFTMPYVEGESLRDRLRRERQLPVDDALRIAREASQALQYAHDHGVIHRDIKPENLLLTRDGNTLVADFGIARALGGEGDARLTETGLSIGTPAYMSPEQAAGDRGVDGRTDVYSLGAVLYELLAGEPPYTGATTQALMVKRLTEPAPSVRSVRSSVPEAVDAAIRKALAPVAADRFSSVAQFAQSLQPATSVPTIAQATGTPGSPPVALPKTGARRIPLAAVTLVLGLLIGLGVLFAWRRNAGDAATGARYLAVLPFENVGDAADEYFADGISDAVRGKLSGVPGLQVIAGRSSAEYKKSDKSLAQIARDLGVSYLVVAKIRWAKAADGTSRVQVSPELVQVPPSGAPTVKWQQSFDAAMTDVFRVQADVAGRVVEELGIALADSARRELAERPTRNLDAYDLYLRAEGAALAKNRTDPASLRSAIALYHRAIALDSTFALAWAQLSRAASILYSNTAPSRELVDLARHGAERAIALAPRQANGHTAMAAYLQQVERDNERAMQALARARQLDPGDAGTTTSLASALQQLGEPDSALALLRQAQRLDPRSPVTAFATGRLLLSLRQYEAADSALRRAQELSPGSLGVVQARAGVRLGRGDLPGARAVVSSAAAEIDRRVLAIYFATYNDLYWVLDSARQSMVVEAGPDDFDGDVGSWGLALAQIYTAWGDRRRGQAYADSARAGFAEQLEAAPEDAQSLALHALSLAYMGRTAEAVREGERAVELLPPSQSVTFGVYLQELLARIYTMAGKPAQAVERLEVVLAHPSMLSRDRLRIDPHFAALRGHPDFRRLVGEKL